MDCPICLEQNNNEMITTACNHVFHKFCLDEWKKINLSCPCCRSKIYDNELNYFILKINDIIHKMRILLE